MQKYTQVKITGLRQNVEGVLSDLESLYVVVPTSQLIRHREDENYHIYLKLVGKRVNGEVVC